MRGIYTKIITYYYQVLRTEHAIAQPLVMDKRLWLTSCSRASTQPHIFSEVFRATMTKFRSVPSSNVRASRVNNDFLRVKCETKKPFYRFTIKQSSTKLHY